MTRSSRSNGSSSAPEVSRPSRSHSTGSPAEIDAATDRKSGSSGPALNGHLLGQAGQRSTDGHVGSGDGWLSEQFGDLGVRVAHLDTQHDRLAVFRLQPLQCRFVALERRGTDRRVPAVRNRRPAVRCRAVPTDVAPIDGFRRAGGCGVPGACSPGARRCGAARTRAAVERRASACPERDRACPEIRAFPRGGGRAPTASAAADIARTDRSMPLCPPPGRERADRRMTRHRNGGRRTEGTPARRLAVVRPWRERPRT